MTDARRDRGQTAAGLAVSAVLLAVGATLLVGPALAHGGSLGAEARSSVSTPTWLVLATGGATVGASFLLASVVTDRAFIRSIDRWRHALPSPGRIATGLVRLVGVLGLVGTLAVCLLGPNSVRPASGPNAGLLFVWVVWWAGYTMSTYLVGSTWRALNPWRTLAESLPTLDEPYPERAGVWPATAALLALVWLEVVSPVAESPRVLGGVIVAYTLVTLTGAVVYGSETWFERADPVSRVFDHYGHVAPLGHEGGVSIRLPGAGLSALPVSERSEVGFVVALLWVTTFDGFVATPVWADVARALGGLGVPLAFLYPVALLAGFGLFLAVYLGAATASRRISDTCLTSAELARRFAPSLLAIAAGYHLAHYLGYFLSLAPSVAVVATTPFAPPTQVPVLSLPGWFGTVGMAAILLGHLLAIWVAHTTAYDLFPGRIQAIRSQYPFIAVMVFYTMTSLWLLSLPEVTPP
jgi:hypothetical protein